MKKIIITTLILIFLIGTCAADQLIVTSDIDNSTLLDTTKSDSGSQTITGIENNAGLQNNNKEIETDDGYYVYDHMETDNTVKVKKEGQSSAETVEPATTLANGDRIYFSDPVYLRAKYNYTPYKGVTVEVQDDLGNAGKTTTFPKMKRTGDSVTVTFHEAVDYDTEKYEFIGISYIDKEGNYHTFQPGESFTVNYDDVNPGENHFLFTYLYDEKILVDPTDDPIVPEDDTGGDNETNNSTDSNVSDDNDSTDQDVNNTVDNAQVKTANNTNNDSITCEIVDNGKPVDKDKNNTKPIALPETGNSFALLISAALIIFVVCLTYWRR